MAGPAFFLGETIDPKSGKRSGERVDYDSSHLVTHGVIVGMTGSGKTGLGTIFLEEALGEGIPALILDRWRHVQLLLTFRSRPGRLPALGDTSGRMRRATAGARPQPLRSRAWPIGE
jgi:DNA helicase HerA-like ATPase